MAATKIKPDAGPDGSVEGIETEPKSRFQRFREAITPNRHTRIETFGKGFVVLSLAFVMLTVSALYSVYQNAHHELTQQAMYTTKFKTSKTAATGSVQGVYSDKAHSKVLVMMKFDTPQAMSSMAANYRTYLSGANSDSTPTDIKSHPSGSIIMFGQTGYLGLYLTNADGFPQQIMSAIMRADKELVAGQGSAGEGGDPRASFQKYDQWELFFNPGGKDAKHIKALDASTMNVGDVYYETVLKEQQEAQRKVLNTDLVTMKADLAAIQDHQARLATTSVNGLHVVMPKLPGIVNGDSVSGQDELPGKPSTLEFHPKETFNNGFNFDWRKRSVNDHIVQSLTPKGQNYITWFTDHLRKQPQNDDTTSLEWKMSDGSNLDDMASSDIAAMQNVNMTVQSLTSALSQYYTDKQKYQVDDLGAYLGLGMSLDDVVQNNNINTSKHAINFYG